MSFVNASACPFTSAVTPLSALICSSIWSFCFSNASTRAFAASTRAFAASRSRPRRRRSPSTISVLAASNLSSSSNLAASNLSSSSTSCSRLARESPTASSFPCSISSMRLSLSVFNSVAILAAISSYFSFICASSACRSTSSISPLLSSPLLSRAASIFLSTKEPIFLSNSSLSCVISSARCARTSASPSSTI